MIEDGSHNWGVFARFYQPQSKGDNMFGYCNALADLPPRLYSVWANPSQFCDPFFVRVYIILHIAHGC